LTDTGIISELEVVVVVVVVVVAAVGVVREEETVSGISAELEVGDAAGGSINKTMRGRSGFDDNKGSARPSKPSFCDGMKEQGVLQEGHRPSEDGP
jgi:hypothetical protein